MKKTILALTLAASLGLAACGDSNKDVVLTSTYGDFTQEDFYKEIKSLAGPQLLEQVMMDKILADKYKATKEEIDEEFNAVADQYGESFPTILAENGFTEESFRSNIRFNILKSKAEADVEVTDEEIQAKYDILSTELNGRHILVEDEATAKELIEKINAGEDFATLATEHSVDPGSGANGGELGWFSTGKMVKQFEDAAYALELNTVSAPVQSEFGYHIIEITEKRKIEGYASLEDEKETIRETVAAEKADWNEISAQLFKDAKIEVKDKDLSEAFSQYK